MSTIRFLLLLVSLFTENLLGTTDGGQAPSKLLTFQVTKAGDLGAAKWDYWGKTLNPDISFDCGEINQLKTDSLRLKQLESERPLVSTTAEELKNLKNSVQERIDLLLRLELRAMHLFPDYGLSVNFRSSRDPRLIDRFFQGLGIGYRTLVEHPSGSDHDLKGPPDGQESANEFDAEVSEAEEAVSPEQIAQLHDRLVKLEARLRLAFR